MKYTTVLMDADDTIFDFPSCEYNAVKQTFEKYGFFDNGDMCKKYSEINERLWKQLERGEVAREQLRTKRFKETFDFFGISADSEEILKISDTYADMLARQDIFIDGAFEAVKKLSNICNVYVITNGLSKVQRGRFSKSPVTEFIKDIFISEEIGFQKPSAKFFNAVLEKIEEKEIEKILVVGDSLTSDMQGGKNAGLKTCIYDRFNKTEMPNELCDYKIVSLDNVCDIVKGKYD